MAEEPIYDDLTMGLHVQGFLDEWYYRMMHSGVACETERPEVLLAALDLLEQCGLTFSQSEKETISQMEDESNIIDLIVSRMSDQVRQSFEHFKLQLQVVMSAAARVRSALEEEQHEDLARMMDEGDAGVNQQILKQSVIEAGGEIGELRKIHDSWEENMSKRLSRMSRCAQEDEDNKMQLDMLRVELDTFGMDQNSKSTKVLMTMTGNNDRMLTQAAFQSWRKWVVKYKAEKDIHEKFQNQIANSQKKLFDYKQARVANVRNALMRSSEDAGRLMVQECFKAMSKLVLMEKDNREVETQVKAAQERLANMQAGQKDNARKTLGRICAGNDETLKGAVFREWIVALEEIKKDREFEKEVQDAQSRFDDFRSTKSTQAIKVITSVFKSSNTGLMHTSWEAWTEEWKANAKARELENMLQAQGDKFKSLNASMKQNAHGRAQKTTDLENDNLMMQLFMEWNCYTRLCRIHAYYGGQLDQKKQQLQAVETMFKSFATQLQQDMAPTPRSTRKGQSHRSTSRSTAQQQR